MTLEGRRRACGCAGSAAGARRKKAPMALKVVLSTPLDARAGSLLREADAAAVRSDWG